MGNGGIDAFVSVGAGLRQDAVTFLVAGLLRPRGVGARGARLSLSAANTSTSSMRECRLAGERM